jgi:hypothetical protein
VQVVVPAAYKITEHFQLVQAQAFRSQWDQVLPKCQPIHNHPTTDQTLCLDQSLPMVVVVGDHGTDMQVVREDQVAVAALHQTVLDQIHTLDQMTVVIKITAAVVLLARDFQAVTACVIIVKAKTVTKQVVEVVPEVQDIPAKMIAIKA